MYFDMTYIIIVLPAMIFAMIASANVKRTFNKYSKQESMRRLSGAQAARMVLNANGLSNVRIEPISGSLTDHFDPEANVVRLSQSVFNNCSTAAIGVACHEVGHAIQHAEGYAPVKIRSAIIPVTNIGSRLAVPLFIAGLLLEGFSYYFIYLAYLGIICFALSTVFQLITLPVEFDASRRAMATIEMQGILTDDELKGTRKVLTAAAMTYVAALAASLAQLLRFLIIANRRRN